MNHTLRLNVIRAACFLRHQLHIDVVPLFPGEAEMHTCLTHLMYDHGIRTPSPSTITLLSGQLYHAAGVTSPEFGTASRASPKSGTAEPRFTAPSGQTVVVTTSEPCADGRPTPHHWPRTRTWPRFRPRAQLGICIRLQYVLEDWSCRAGNPSARAGCGVALVLPYCGR